MAKTTAPIWISDNQYVIQGELFDVSWDYTGSNGVIAPLNKEGLPVAPGELGEFAIVLSGTEMGYLNVTVEVRQTAPTRLDLADWDEVAEVSLALTGDRAGLVTYSSDTGGTDLLPDFKAAGSGPYRVRIHVRGRDEGQRVIHATEQAVEDHLIIVWSAPYGQETVHKATDAYGAELRSS